MAKSDGGVDSWPGLLGELNKNFSLLRDVFGYAMPGGMFFAVGVISGQLSFCRVKCLLLPYEPPMWAAFILGTVACYVTGNILAGTAYMLVGVAKYIVWMLDRHCWGRALSSPPRFREKFRDACRAWLVGNPTEVAEEVLVIRSQHPELLDVLGRRETLTMLAGSTAVALLGGWLFFYKWKLPASCIFLIAGGVLVIQFLTGLSHLRRVQAATVAAAVECKPPKPDPDFQNLLARLIEAASAWLGGTHNP